MPNSSKENGSPVRSGRSYLDLLSGELPALERNILKYRAFQIILVIFYCDHLKRKIRSLVATQNRFREILKNKKTNDDGHTNEGKNAKKSLATLKDWGLLDEEETEEIVELINYRNIIAHEIHRLVGDIGAKSSMFRIGDYLKGFRYDAVERLRHFLNAIENRAVERGYVISIDMDSLVFESAERSYEDELGKLKKRIDLQYAHRVRKIDALNREISLEGTELTDEHHPNHPLNSYENHRLTKRGQEICYRLFDLDKSEMAVAALMQVSSAAAKKRKSQWRDLGGKNRRRVSLSSFVK